MATRILLGGEYEGEPEHLLKAVFFCSTTGRAFGPVVRSLNAADHGREDGPYFDAQDVAQSFLDYWKETDGRDPRLATFEELNDVYGKFRESFIRRLAAQEV